MDFKKKLGENPQRVCLKAHLFGGNFQYADNS